MKTINTVLVFFLFLTICSCSKSDDDNQDLFEGTMEARINGELYIFDRASGQASFDLDNGCFKDFHAVTGSIGFDGISSEGHSIILYFKPSMGLGSYQPYGRYMTYKDWNPSNTLITQGYNQDHFCVETQTHQIEDGLVTITSTSNGRYKGSFYFTGCDGCCNETVIISEGKFDIAQKLPLSCH
jgi:hypothetical protein